jgi:hypothetical protein
MSSNVGSYLDLRSPKSARVAPRRLVSIPVVVVSSAVKRSPAKITNLSRMGCRVEIGCRFALGEFLLLSLPDNLLLSSNVIWSSGTASGVKFRATLNAAVLDKLLAKHPRKLAVLHPEPLATWATLQRGRPTR